MLISGGVGYCWGGNQGGKEGDKGERMCSVKNFVLSLEGGHPGNLPLSRLKGECNRKKSTSLQKRNEAGYGELRTGTYFQMKDSARLLVI